MVDWKSRYAELIEQTERQQGRYKRRFQLLSDGFLSALQLSRGLNDGLDRRLLAAQRLLRQEGTKNVDLEQGINALQHSAATALEQRQTALKAAAESLRRVCQQTREMSIDAETVQVLKGIEKQLKVKQPGLQLLLDQITAFQTAHKQAIKQNKSGGTGGLFGRFRATPSVIRAPLDDDADQETPLDESEGVIHELDTDGEIQSGPERGRKPALAKFKPAEPESPKVADIIRERFSLLLQALGRPDSTHGLQTKLQGEIKDHEFGSVIDDVSGISVSLLIEERQEHEVSLQRLNKRIAESVNQVDQCTALEAANDAANQDMHQRVGQGLADITDALAKAQDLGTLQQSIKLTLSDLNEALTDHQRHAEEQALTSSLQGLTQQLNHVQDMSRASMFRVQEQTKQSLVDQCTGLPGRFALYRDADQLLALKPLAVAVGRMDQAVTELPRQVAGYRAIAKHWGPGVTTAQKVYYLEPNQFLVVATNMTQQAFAMQMDAVRQTIGKETTFTISIGISMTTNSDTIESVLARADRVSRGGANQTHLATN